MMTENLKLSEASKACGINVRTLKLLVADGLLPQAVRTPQGHALLPSDAVPTWEECRDLIKQKRDIHLQRAAKLLDRVRVELEAIGNDIAEARDYPAQPLGVDFMAATSYSAGPSQTTLSAVLTQFDMARMEVQIYHRALTEVVTADRV